MNPDELVFDSSVVAPGALDANIATCTLRPITNRPADGIDLEVSATFGKERISIEGEGFSGTVLMSLNRAVLELVRVRCDLEIKDDSFASDYTYHSRDVKQNEEQQKLKYSGGILGTLSPHQKIRAQASVNSSFGRNSNRGSTNSETVDLTWSKNWVLLDDDKIKVGLMDGRELRAREMEARCWRVVPQKGTDSAAIALRLVSRSDWINFEEVEADSFSGRIGRRVKKYLKSKSSLNRELFELLLKNLAAKGLCSDKTNDAVLAGKILILRRVQDTYGTSPFDTRLLPNASPEREIRIDSEAIEHFLELPHKKQFRFLKAIGASSRYVDALEQKFNSQFPPKRYFTANSAPPTVLAALVATTNSPPMPVDLWENTFDSRVRSDLSALGLILTVDGIIRSQVRSSSAVEAELRKSASKSPLIAAARAHYIKDPDASTLEIGIEIQRQFNRTYNSDRSRANVGRKLRRWVLWLESDLADPKRGRISEQLHLAATMDKPSRGAVSRATKERLLKAQELLDAGLSVTKAAEQIGVGRSTLFLWRQQGKLK